MYMYMHVDGKYMYTHAMLTVLCMYVCKHVCALAANILMVVSKFERLEPQVLATSINLREPVSAIAVDWLRMKSPLMI